MARLVVLLSFLTAVFVLSACESGASPGDSDRSSAAAARPAAQGPRFIRGPTGGKPIAPFVKSQQDRSAAQGRRLLVYVGAKWCEPCQHFHDAVEAGRLDSTFPNLDLVEFDLDADRDALEAAGYASRMIPLFAVPDSEGRGSAKRIAGSIKGPQAVDANLVPRLRELLGTQAK